MALTPVDIEHTKFKTSIRGYCKSQVDQFVSSATEALADALNENTALRRKIDALQEDLDRIRKIEATMTDALVLAQKSADELKANAYRHAEMIVQEAEQARVRMMVEAQKDLEDRRMELAHLEFDRNRFESEFRALLSSYLEMLGKTGSGENVRSEVA